MLVGMMWWPELYFEPNIPPSIGWIGFGLGFGLGSDPLAVVDANAWMIAIVPV